MNPTPDLFPSPDAAKVVVALRMVSESDARMTAYTVAQKAELGRYAREIISNAPTARYIGLFDMSAEQETMPDSYCKPLRLFNLLRPTGTYPAGAILTEDDLEAAGVDVPVKDGWVKGEEI